MDKHVAIIFVFIFNSFGFFAHSQEIMSFSEYDKIDHDEPYIVELFSKKGGIIYIGADHLNDPDHSQFKKLKQIWHQYDFDIALNEGGNFSVEGMGANEAIEKYGEAGLTRWMAENDGVPVKTLDPPRNLIINHLKDSGNWTDEHLKLFYTLRNVAQSNRMGKKVNFNKELPEYLKYLTEKRGLSGGPLTFESFDQASKKWFPELKDWRKIPNHYFYPGAKNDYSFTNEISTSSNIFRDRYHVRMIGKLLGEGKMIFAVAGSAHVVMQEPALNSFLKELR